MNTSTSPVVVVTEVLLGIGRATAEKFVSGACPGVRHRAQCPGSRNHFRRRAGRDGRSQRRIGPAGDRGCARKGKRIDVLVNNAGATMLGAVEDDRRLRSAALYSAFDVFGTLRHLRKGAARHAGAAVRADRQRERSGSCPRHYMGVLGDEARAFEGLSGDARSRGADSGARGHRRAVVHPDQPGPQCAGPPPRLVAYDADRDGLRAIVGSVLRPPAPSDSVAQNHRREAALGGWKMLWTPRGEASLAASAVRAFGSEPRKTFGLA